MLIRKLSPHLHWHSCDLLMLQPVFSHFPVWQQSVSVEIRITGHFQMSPLSEPIFLADCSLIHAHCTPCDCALSTTEFDYQVSRIYVKIWPWLNTCQQIVLWQTWEKLPIYHPLHFFFSLSGSNVNNVTFSKQFCSFGTIQHPYICHYQNCHALLICQQSNMLKFVCSVAVHPFVIVL